MMWNSYKILSLCLKSPNPRCLSFQNDLVTVIRQDALQHLMNYVCQTFSRTPLTWSWLSAEWTTVRLVRVLVDETVAWCHLLNVCKSWGDYRINSWHKIYQVLRAYSFIAAILASSCKSCMFPEKGRLRCHWWLSGVPGANKSAAIPPARLVRRPWISGVILHPKWLGCLCCAFFWWLRSGMSECRLVAPCQTSACWPLREGQ